MTVSIIVETDVSAVAARLGFKTGNLSEVARVTIDDLTNRAWLDFQRTVMTWKQRSLFTREIKPISMGYESKIETKDRIYFFIDKGTRVRYATMTADFIAKTRPGVLGSRAGRGGVLFISKKHPRPGIQARRFTETIQEKYDKLADEIATKHIREWQAKA